MELSDRPRVRVLARIDRFDRFVSAIIFVPREEYNSYVREKIGDYLSKVYDGHISAYYPAFLKGCRPRPLHRRPHGRQDAAYRPG